jgi:hypothetical protein
MIRVTLIGRVGCHLCGIARDQVLGARAQKTFELVELDVDSDPELRAEYGEQVPVVLIEGKMHSFFDVDREMLVMAVADAENAH